MSGNTKPGGNNKPSGRSPAAQPGSSSMGTVAGQAIKPTRPPKEQHLNENITELKKKLGKKNEGDVKNLEAAIILGNQDEANKIATNLMQKIKHSAKSSKDKKLIEDLITSIVQGHSTTGSERGLPPSKSEEAYQKPSSGENSEELVWITGALCAFQETTENGVKIQFKTYPATMKTSVGHFMYIQSHVLAMQERLQTISRAIVQLNEDICSDKLSVQRILETEEDTILQFINETRKELNKNKQSPIKSSKDNNIDGIQNTIAQLAAIDIAKSPDLIIKSQGVIYNDLRTIQGMLKQRNNGKQQLEEQFKVLQSTIIRLKIDIENENYKKDGNTIEDADIKIIKDILLERQKRTTENDETLTQVQKELEKLNRDIDPANATQGSSTKTHPIVLETEKLKKKLTLFKKNVEELNKLREEKGKKFEEYQKDAGRQIEKERKKLNQKCQSLEKRNAELESLQTYVQDAGNAMIPTALKLDETVLGIPKKPQKLVNNAAVMDLVQETIERSLREMQIIIAKSNSLNIFEELTCLNDLVKQLQSVKQIYVPRKLIQRDLYNLYTDVTGSRYGNEEAGSEKPSGDKRRKNKDMAEAHNEISISNVVGDMAFRIKQQQGELKEEIKRYTDENKNLQLQVQRLNESMESMENRISELQKEKDDVLSRLSKLAGVKMTDNNPNVADLSDENRPTKLGERYSELYDNQWTNAFEQLTGSGKTDVEAVQQLYTLLTNCYTFCVEIGDYQTFVIQSTLICPVQDVKSSHVQKKDMKLPEVETKIVADLRKQTAKLSTKDLQEANSTPESGIQGDIKLFVDLCVELCWLMRLHSPPVFLQTNLDKKQKFDTKIFKEYTRTGKKIDYVVWPPLFLHEGGPILSKGVAQGLK